jgi:hypothetical protein
MLAIAGAWLAGSVALSASGFLSKRARFTPVFTLTPPLAFAATFALSRRVRAWARAFDTRSLVSVQTARTGGIAFLAAHAVGKLNGKFALEAGLIDAAVGITAPFAAYHLTPPRTKRQRRLLIAWMVPGILDFFVAIPLAALARAEDPASMASLPRLPLSLITTWAVPIALIDYFILGAQLWQQRRQAWS